MFFVVIPGYHNKLCTGYGLGMLSFGGSSQSAHRGIITATHSSEHGS